MIMVFMQFGGTNSFTIHQKSQHTPDDFLPLTFSILYDVRKVGSMQ